MNLILSFSFKFIFRFVLDKNINENYIPTIYHYEPKSNERKKANSVTFSYAKIHTIHVGNRYYRPSSNNRRRLIHWTRPHHNAPQHHHYQHAIYVHKLDNILAMATITIKQHNRIVCSRTKYAKCVKTISNHANSATKMPQINWAHVEAASVAVVVWPFNTLQSPEIHCHTIPSTIYAKFEPFAIPFRHSVSIRNCWRWSDRVVLVLVSVVVFWLAITKVPLYGKR